MSGPSPFERASQTRPVSASVAELIVELQSVGLRVEAQLESRKGGAGPTPDQCAFCGIEVSLRAGRTVAKKSPAQRAEVAVVARRRPT